MPKKFNADHRNKILTQKQRVTNWPDYDESQRRHGDLIVSTCEHDLGLWSVPFRKTCGGQRRYSDLAIEWRLTLGP